MEKSFSPIKALICAALLVIIFVSLFLPVVSFNSTEAFGETKIGWYDSDLSDLAHAGKIKVSLISVILASGKDVDTLAELYKLGEDKAAALVEGDTEKAASYQAEIDAKMNELSGSEADSRIQKKLNDKKFLKKVALRAAMYDVENGSSYLTLPMIITVIAIAILACDIALKVVKLIKSKLELNESAVKALSDFKLPIVAFILHMFTIQHFVAKTRGTVSLGYGIVIGLAAMLAFAVARGFFYVLETKEMGEDKYKKTIIKQSITLGILVMTVVISLVGMKMSGLMIYDMNLHYSEFVDRYVFLATKIDPAEAAEKVAGSMNIVVSVLAAIPILLYSALGYMLARTAVVEKVRFKNSRKPVTPLGSFYIGFIFVAAAYILTFVLFVANDSAKRKEMYANCQMSVVFTEYKDEDSQEYKYYTMLSDAKNYLVELKEEYTEQYNNTDDEKQKAEIKDDLEDTKLEIKAVEKQMDRIEDRKKSNMILIIVLGVIATAADVVFKNVKFEAERIAESGKEN